MSGGTGSRWWMKGKERQDPWFSSKVDQPDMCTLFLRKVCHIH